VAFFLTKNDVRLNSMRSVIIFMVVFLFGSPFFAQDKVLLMNGQEFSCRIVSDSTVDIVFEVTRKSGKLKTYERHKSDVFSYTYSGQPEKVLYAMDTLLGDMYTEQAMRVYLAGERDARENYHPIGTAVAGFVICGTIAYAGQDGYLTLMAPPVLYTLAQLVPKLKIREKTMSNPDYKYNDYYADGYEPPARSKKVVRAMESSFAGAATGMALWFLIGKK
jgi:hypothetical protein